MGNQTSSDRGRDTLPIDGKEKLGEKDVRHALSHEESPFLALCPRTIDPQGFLASLNSNVRQLNEANEFVSEFRGNAVIVQEALDLFAAQAPKLFVEACSQSSVICDYRLPDIPIVWCNDYFERLSLYPKEMIVGRNCRFLQGPLTNRDTVDLIRRAIKTGTSCDVDLLNYRRDGVPFWNRFSVFPIFDKAGIRYFFSIQRSFKTANFRETPFNKWTPVEVALFLREIGMDRYAPSFFQQEIDGEALPELSRSDLKLLGISYRNEKRKFRTAVKTLVKCQSASPQATSPNSQENLRTIKLYFQGANPYVLVVNPAFLTIFELEEAACKLYGVEVLRLSYSSSSYKHLLSSFRSPTSDSDVSANSQLNEKQKKSENSTEKSAKGAPRKVLIKKATDRDSESVIGPSIHQLDRPKGSHPFRSVAEIPIEDLTEIGSTAQLVNLLKPLNNHTLVVHALESADRDLTLMRFANSIDESFIPILLVSRSHVIIKANHAAAKFLQCGHQQNLMGLRISHFFPEIYKQKSSQMSLVLKTDYLEGRYDGSAEEEEGPRVQVEISVVCGECFCLKLQWAEENSSTSTSSLSVLEIE